MVCMRAATSTAAQSVGCSQKLDVTGTSIAKYEIWGSAGLNCNSINYYNTNQEWLHGLDENQGPPDPPDPPDPEDPLADAFLQPEIRYSMHRIQGDANKSANMSQGETAYGNGRERLRRHWRFRTDNLLFTPRVIHRYACSQTGRRASDTRTHPQTNRLFGSPHVGLAKRDMGRRR